LIYKDFFYPSPSLNENETLVETKFSTPNHEEGPITIDFLNQKEQEAIDKLNMSRSRSSNASISKSLLQDIRTPPKSAEGVLQRYAFE